VAILAGDGLYAEAFRHLLTDRRTAPERVLRAAAEAGGRHGRERDGGRAVPPISIIRLPPGGAALRRLHELKTGRLIGASVLCRTTVGRDRGCTCDQSSGRFAAELGVLFQIV